MLTEKELKNYIDKTIKDINFHKHNVIIYEKILKQAKQEQQWRKENNVIIKDKTITKA